MCAGDEIDQRGISLPLPHELRLDHQPHLAAATLQDHRHIDDLGREEDLTGPAPSSSGVTHNRNLIVGQRRKTLLTGY